MRGFYHDDVFFFVLMRSEGGSSRSRFFNPDSDTAEKPIVKVLSRRSTDGGSRSSKTTSRTSVTVPTSASWERPSAAPMIEPAAPIRSTSPIRSTQSSRARSRSPASMTATTAIRQPRHPPAIPVHEPREAAHRTSCVTAMIECLWHCPAYYCALA